MYLKTFDKLKELGYCVDPRDNNFEVYYFALHYCRPIVFQYVTYVILHKNFLEKQVYLNMIGSSKLTNNLYYYSRSLI